MQMRKKTLATQIAAATLTAGVIGFSAPALSGGHEDGGTHGLVNLTAGVELSNMYLFRGENLGEGTPLIAGWLEAESSGAYIGAWVAGGDIEEGTEIDLYAGYGFDVTDAISLEFGVINYIYPTADGDVDQDGFGDFTEVFAGLGAYGFDFEYYNNVAGSTGDQYYTVSYGIGAFSALVGHQDNSSRGSGPDNLTHVDVTYMFNDELSFTVSQVVDNQDRDARKTTFISAMYALEFDL